MQLNLSRRLDAIDDKPRVLLLDKVQRSHHINTKKMTAVMTSSPVTIDDVKERRRGTSGETLDDDIVFKSNVDGVYSKLSAFAIFFFPAVGGLLYGYDIGATSAVVTQLKSLNYSGVQWHATIAGNSSLRGVITAMSTLGALIGSIACFRIADLFGRRRCLLLATSLYLIGAVLEVVSGGPVWDATTGISILLLGRLIYGLGCGFTMVGAPAYIGEMAPPAIRGILVSLKEVLIVLGITFGYTFGYIYSTVPGGWRYTYGLSIPFTSIMFIGMYFLPSSARWLALKGRLEEAKLSMKFVTPNLPEEAYEAVRIASEKVSLSNSDSSIANDYRRLTSPTVFPAMVAGVGLVFFQQITGQPSVLYYADSLFQDVGLSSYSSILVSLFKLVATLVATFTVDSQGRKVLLYVGCSLMLLALIGLGTAFLFPYSSSTQCNAFVSSDTCISSCAWDTATCDISTCSDAGVTGAICKCCGTNGITPQKAVILASLFIYIGGYQVGFGPISWLLISEIFPLEVRGKAVSIAVVTNFFWNTVVTFLFPVELEYIGSAPTFYVYAGVLIAGIYFIYKKVPETKGMSLEEIEEFFVHSSKDFLDTEGSTNSNSRSSSEKLEGKDNCEAKDFNERLSSLI